MATTYTPMAFPTGWETPAAALRAGRKFWYLRATPTIAYAAGDLSVPYYEVPVGVKAIAIGPGSDLSQVVVLWYPPKSTQEFAFFVDVRNPLIMDLPVDPKTLITNSNGSFFDGRGASIKIIPYYMYPHLPLVKDPDYAVLELLCYFDLVGVTLPKSRPDNGSSGGGAAGAGVAETMLFEAFSFGRNRVSWEINVLDAVETITDWRFVGVSYYDALTAIEDVEHVISATNTIAALGSASYVLTGTRYHAVRLYATGSGAGVDLIWRYNLIDD